MKRDLDLLRAYAQTRSEVAFATLVEQYQGLVYGAALRQTRDRGLAEEITQAVFIDLARKCRTLRPGTILLDWFEQPRERAEPPVIAWIGENPKSRRWGKKIRLFKSTWENPLPEVAIETVDFLALKSGPSPFLVALTAE